jgi:hypothetical protein
MRYSEDRRTACTNFRAFALHMTKEQSCLVKSLPNMLVFSHML